MPRVPGRTEAGQHSAAHRKFQQVELAYKNSPSPVQSFGDGGLVSWNPIRGDFRAVCRTNVLGSENILGRIRNAVKGPEVFARTDVLLRLPSLLHRMIPGNRNECIDLRI